MNTGNIVQIIGGCGCEFTQGDIPQIYDALKLK